MQRQSVDSKSEANRVAKGQTEVVTRGKKGRQNGATYLPGPAVGSGFLSIDHTSDERLNGWFSTPKGCSRNSE